MTTNKTPYNKIITVYDIRKTIHLNYGTRPVGETLNTILNYNDRAKPYLCNTSANYLADLENIVDNLEVKTTFDLIPYADTIYMEQYYHTLQHSLVQFHYDNIAVIRRFTKLFDKERTFSKLHHSDNIVAMFLSKVLMCGSNAYEHSLHLSPSKDCTHYTWCMCEFMAEVCPIHPDYGNITASEIISICDRIYNLNFKR